MCIVKVVHRRECLMTEPEVVKVYPIRVFGKPISLKTT